MIKSASDSTGKMSALNFSLPTTMYLSFRPDSVQTRHSLECKNTPLPDHPTAVLS